MMALRNRVQDLPPSEIEALLPWHAAGTLNAREARRVDEALAGNPDLARQYAAIREECAETVLLNESLGAPSSRAMRKLFAAIDAEPVCGGFGSPVLARLAGYVAGLSPRTLIAAAATGALAILLQAGVIGGLVMQRGAPAIMTHPMASGPATETGPHVLVRFTPSARMSDITALLDTYQATLVDGSKAGQFRLQLGLPMTPEQVAGWIGRLRNEKMVSSVAAAP